MITNDEKIALLRKLNTDKDLSGEFFYEVLEKCEALKKNYYDYMTTDPIDSKKELLRLPTADYDLCCALDKIVIIVIVLIVVDNPQFGGAQKEQMRSAFAKLGVVKFK